MIELNDIQKEQLRHVVLEVLVTRSPNALNRKMILNRAAQEVDFSLDLTNIVTALDFLKGLVFVEMLPDEMGSSEYWKASTAGILAHERSKRPGQPRRD